MKDNRGNMFCDECAERSLNLILSYLLDKPNEMNLRIFYSSKYSLYMVDYGDFTIQLCPKHKHLAIKWLQKIERWKRERN